MPFDLAAADLVASEATRVFQAGLNKLIVAAAREAELEWQRLQNEQAAIAEDRRRLEEAWKLLHNAERARVEDLAAIARRNSSSMMNSIPAAPLVTSPKAGLGLSATRLSASDWAPFGRSTAENGSSPGAHVGNCIVLYGQNTFSVLPPEDPGACKLGHNCWNEAVEIPEGWEVLSKATLGFDEAMAFLSQHCWGAMVLGVRNANQGFDAYWTPLFGDGSHAGQLCQADVDWIEPLEPKHEGRHFRMTYTGLRLVICQKQANRQGGSAHVWSHARKVSVSGATSVTMHHAMMPAQPHTATAVQSWPPHALQAQADFARRSLRVNGM